MKYKKLKLFQDRRRIQTMYLQLQYVVFKRNLESSVKADICNAVTHVYP
jgi:hypothetical protein